MEIGYIQFLNSQTNVAQLNLTVYDSFSNIIYESLITSVTDKNYIATSQKASKIKLIITKTTDNLPPRYVTLSVKACAPEETTTVTTPTSIFSTLTTSIIN